MKKVNEENLKQELPQLQLDESTKERIHTTLLNHQPSSSLKKNLWQRGKWSSLVATAVGIFVFSLLTVYIISETERNREHERFVHAQKEIQTVYEEMEGKLQNKEDGQLLVPIDDTKMKTAQASISKIKAASESEKDKKKFISMMREIEMYNHTVPQANELQNHINNINKILSQSVFDEGLEESISVLKDEMTKKLKTFEQLENASLKAFLGKYTGQLNTLEDEFNKYMGIQEEVQTLKKLAEDQSVEAQDFDKRVENLLNQVQRLSNKQMGVMMEDEINMAKAKYHQLRVEAEEKKRKEEEKITYEKASTSNEMNSSSGSKGKEKQNSDMSSPEEELYPLEFTMTDSGGFTFKLSRDFDNYQKGKGYDEIARRYGARFYYTPHSDMSHVIIGRKIIATVSLVSGAPVEYKDLFIDLMTYQSKKYTREQFATIVDTVIESGEPYKVEEGDSGELLSLENGVLRYDSW